MCGCECCIYANIMNSSVLTWIYSHLKHLKYRSHNAKNRRYGWLSNCLFETYKNAERPHVCHIYNSAADMAMATMCTCPSQHHALPHCKFVLSCCDKFPGISIPHQGTNTEAKNTCSTIYFHVYRNVSRCTVHGLRPYEEWTICSMCSTYLSSVTPVKVYTRKELVLLETLI